MTEKRTFKWGDSEYLLDDLLNLHAAQENYFYNFARDRGQYDDVAIQGLRQAIEKEINAAKNGEHFEADGSLATDVVDNVSIQTQKNGLFRKEIYTEQDNTAWAKYYTNKLVSNLKKYNKESKDKGWDINQNGLTAYFNNGLNWKAKEIFENYDKRDKNNPKKDRIFEQRNSLLKEGLTKFRDDYISQKNFNYTENDNEWDDNYEEKLDYLIKNFDEIANDRTKLSSHLRALGLDDAYITAFTSDRFNLSKTDEELNEENKKLEEEKKAKEEKDKYAQFARDTYNTYENLSDNNLGGTYFTSKGDGLFDMSDSEYEEWLSTHTKDKDSYMNQLQKNYYENPFDPTIAGEYLPLAARFGGIKEVNINGKNWYYDPKTIDRKNNRVVIFDKETGEMKHTFIGDIEEEWKNIKRNWRLENGYEDAADKYIQYKQGGTLYMQTGGDFNLAQSVNRDLEERNRKRAEETGNTEKIQKARDRIVSQGNSFLKSEKDSISQPDAGFTGAEKARLATIVADIGSIFLDPISGTTVGIGSSLVNFGADVADDGFQLKDLGNLGINVGLDLLGAIPLFGDVVGTGTKIIRNLAKWTPRILAGLAGIQGVANMGEIMNSVSKIGNKDEKLTVQDWRNISQGISLLTGGVRAIKNKSAQHKVIKDAKTDAIVVGVRNKNNEAVEHVIVNGETAQQIKNNKNDAKKIEEILLKNKEFKDKFGDSNIWTIDIKKGERQFPIRRVKDDLDGKKHLQWESRKKGLPSIQHYYDFNKIRGYSSSWGWTPRTFGSTVNNWHNKTIKLFNPDIDSSLDIRNWNVRTSTNKQEIIEKARLDLQNLQKITKPKKPKNPTSEQLQQYNDDSTKYRDYILNKQRLLGIIQGNSLTLKKQGGSINQNKLNKFLNYGKR